MWTKPEHQNLHCSLVKPHRKSQFARYNFEACYPARLETLNESSRTVWLSRDLITNSHLVEKFLEPFGIFVDAKTFAAAAGFNPANRKQGNKTTNGADFCNTSHSTWVPNTIWLDLIDNFPFQGESLSLYVVLRYVSHITVTLERD